MAEQGIERLNHVLCGESLWDGRISTACFRPLSFEAGTITAQPLLRFDNSRRPRVEGQGQTPLASVPDQAVGTKEGGRPPDFLARRNEMIGLLTLENVRRYMPHHPRGFHMGDSRTAPIDRAAV